MACFNLNEVVIAQLIVKRLGIAILGLVSFPLCSCAPIKSSNSAPLRDLKPAESLQPETRTGQPLLGTTCSSVEQFGCRARADFAALERSVKPELESPSIPIPDLPQIERFVEYYSREQRGIVEQGLSRGRDLLPRIESVLRKQGVPLDLVGVIIVESRFCENARSPGGRNVGLWQFSPETARSHGLSVSVRGDERKDAFRSTEAAARYFNGLYQRFGDWHLALAAFNAGENRVQGWVSRSGHSSFVELSKRGQIPRHIEAFVFKVLALAKILRDPSRYGFAVEGYARVRG